MRDQPRWSASLLGVASAMLLLAGCTTATGSTGPPSGVTDADVAITSRDLRFDVATVTLPADQPFSLKLTNLEAAPHNVAIYKDSSAADDVFVGDVISNSSIVYEVPALDAGTYFFRCDVHPEMNGSLVAG